MRVHVEGTTGSYYFHVFYKDEEVNFKILVGPQEVVAEERGTGQIGHLAVAIGGYLGWVEITGRGQIFAVVVSPYPDVDEEFTRSLRAEDLTQLADVSRVVLADATALDLLPPPATSAP